MSTNKRLKLQRRRRHRRVSNKLRGGPDRPRLSIYRSHQNISAQLIDDLAGRTIASASTAEKEICGSYGGNAAAAGLVGKTIAERAQAAGVKQVRFDRGPYKYHGRVAALADAAREGGLEF